MPTEPLVNLSYYQSAIINANMGLWEYDMSSGMLSWDEGFRLLYGFNESVYGCPAQEFMKKLSIEEQDKITNGFLLASQNGKPVDIIFTAKINSGEMKSIRCRCFRVEKDNQLLKLVGLHIDITEESLLRTDLKKANDFTDVVLDSIPDIVFVKNENFEIIYVNSAYEKFAGRNKKDVIGKTDFDIFPEKQAEFFRQQDRKVLKNESAQEFNGEVRDHAGHTYEVNTKKTLITTDSNEKLIIGIVHDLAELKLIQKSLINQSKMASLGEMAADIAHEINNPLMIIQGRSQILLNKIDSENVNMANCKKDLEAIEKNCVRIDKIIKSLKSVTRKSDLDTPEEVVMLSLINEAYEISIERFKKRRLELQVTCAANIDLNIKTIVRPSEIVQVLMNLLNNSYDAIKHRSNAWAKINLSVNENFLSVEVMDSGSEILPEIAKKMMEPFFTTKPSGKGTGLGLSLSRQIIINHGGDLTYDQKSPYTKFVFTLPKI